jgi:hypothetical protein
MNDQWEAILSVKRIINQLIEIEYNEMTSAQFHWIVEAKSKLDKMSESNFDAPIAVEIINGLVKDF